MIYFDNAASSFPKAPNIEIAISDLICNYGGNSGRASHRISIKLSEMLFETRENLTELINGDDSSKMIFTQNCTEALNTSIFGVIKKNFNVLTSEMEHNSVMRPLRYLEKKQKIKLKFFKSLKNGYPDIDDYISKLKTGINLVVCTACSNVNGIIFPFQKLSNLAKQYNSLFILDAAQLIGIHPIDVKKTDIDILCFPGHKGLLGPHGTGGFYINSNIKIRPLRYGGTGSKSESEYQPEFNPDIFESGTLNLCGIAGLNKSIEFIKNLTIKKIRCHEKKLTAYFTKKLKELNTIKIIGDCEIENKTSVISIISSKLMVNEIADILDEYDIAVRVGLHCAPAAHKTLGTFPTGTIRFSPGIFNTEKEIDEIIKILINYKL